MKQLPDYNAPSALAAVLDEHGFGMQKKFGQNFLINAHIRQGYRMGSRPRTRLNDSPSFREKCGFNRFRD